MEDAQWLKADYYDCFYCKGGACRNSCCEGWEIAVDMEDYFRLIALDGDGELHHRIECAFRVPEVPSPERYRLISPNWLGSCPLHDENGLCMLHRDLGAEALPELCRVYPRSLKQVGGERRACCSNSCERVIELLLRDAPLNFFPGSLNLAPECTDKANDQQLALSRIALAEIRNRARPLRTRIGNISICMGEDLALPGPEATISGLRALLRALDALAPNFVSLERAAKPALERYGAAPERYWADEAAFETRFPLWAAWFENILANHIFYSDFPAVDERLSNSDACAGLCLIYGAMRAICIATHAEGAQPAQIIDALAGLFRMAEHSAYYYNARVLVPSPGLILAL